MTTTTTDPYAELNREVRAYCQGSTYAARKHSHRQVMAHADHSVEFVNLPSGTALCCHTCKIVTAY